MFLNKKKIEQVEWKINLLDSYKYEKNFVTNFNFSN